jgi:3-oxoacyl-[acyl-carrier protein] reductase
MDTALKNKVVLVTGASTGIGRATAIAFGREGARVALTYHSKADAAERTATAVRGAGGDALVLPLELADEASVTSLVAAVGERWGALHTLVNNAVRWPAGFLSVDELTPEELRASLAANVEGPLTLIRAALPLLRAHRTGRIVNVSTGLAVDGYPRSLAYIMPKGAMHAATRTLAKELAPSGILINVVLAGAVASEARERPAWMIESMKRSAATGRLTEADEVARVIVFLGSPANGHINGELVRADGLFVTPPRAEGPPFPSPRSAPGSHRDPGRSEG